MKIQNVKADFLNSKGTSTKPILFPLIFFFSFLILAFFGIKSPSAQAEQICFCHSTGSDSNPSDTICTSDQGQQQGHTNHGDPDFGCFCGDGTCDPSDGEDQYTCPQDCGAPPTCDDGNIDDGEECGEPGLFCTVAGETCVGCRCTPPPPECFTNDNCDDNNVCNGTELCLNTGNCSPGTPLSCDDGNPCNGTETCDSSDGCQPGTPVTCDDSRTCSTDTCDTQTGLCDFDVSQCKCDNDTDCDDGNPCTDDVCDVSAGTCSNTNNDQNACSDDDACTSGDHCASGECTGSAVTCDDQNPCTDDSCDPAQGCLATANNANSCDDGNPCNGSESCQAGTCVAGQSPVCDDGRSCSANDTCNPESGLCVFDLSQCECEVDLDCNDGNPCTNDSCDSQTGKCVFQDNGTCQTCTDSDGDGKCDGEDNCPTSFNPGQEDQNQNGIGDACEGTPVTNSSSGMTFEGSGCSLSHTTEQGSLPMGSAWFLMILLVPLSLLSFRARKF